MLYSAVHKCFYMQTVKRVNASLMEKAVYAIDDKATSGFCLHLNERFDVEKQGDIWVERPGTSRPIHENQRGRPPLEDGKKRDAFLGANVTPDLKEWAVNQPEGASALINRLLLAERERRN